MTGQASVILLHGLGRSPASMRPLALRLAADGYATRIIGYPSRKATILRLAGAIAPKLPAEGRVHIVGHSLGGIIAKPLMLGLPADRRGRIVQLGSPNLGSELAARIDFLEPVLGPALAELQPGPEATLLPGEETLEIGAIAGTAAIRPYGLLTGIEGENDGKVSVASAWGTAPGHRRIKLPVAHSTMMLNDAVIDAVARFLAEGRF
jgi:pimeloyl-ACP methyl ester carboxylesterase